jgi:hypothetical protein
MHAPEHRLFAIHAARASPESKIFPPWIATLAILTKPIRPMSALLFSLYKQTHTQFASILKVPIPIPFPSPSPIKNLGFLASPINATIRK